MGKAIALLPTWEKWIISTAVPISKKIVQASAPQTSFDLSSCAPFGSSSLIPSPDVPLMDVNWPPEMKTLLVVTHLTLQLLSPQQSSNSHD